MFARDVWERKMPIGPTEARKDPVAKPEVYWGMYYCPPADLLKDHPGGRCCMEWNDATKEWVEVEAESDIADGYKAPTSKKIKEENGSGTYDKERILIGCEDKEER